MRLITVGDNVTDCYLDDGIFYPGGQAVNVAVDAKRDGAEQAAYLGIFGDDARADYIRECLALEGVSCDRCRTAHAPTALPGVRLVDGDRVFVGGPRDSCQHLFSLRIVREDLELISQFDVCHTTNEAGVDHELAMIHEVVPLSYDFSTDRDEAYLRRVCPFVDFAFFSGSGMTREEVDTLIAAAHGLGSRIVIVTLGDEGSVGSDGGRIVFQPIVRTESVDSMGAGDSYAAAFLVNYLESSDLEASMAFAAERAASTCTLRGAFGHPHKME